MPPNAPPPKKLTEKELKDKAEQKWGKRNIGKVEKIRRRKIKTRNAEEEIENEVQRGVFKENLENAKKQMMIGIIYLYCSTKQDITLVAQLTTFITIFKTLSDLKIPEELQKLQQAENIVRDIFRFLTQLKAERKPVLNNQQQSRVNENDVVTRNQKYINSLREMIHKKIEEINTQMVLYMPSFSLKKGFIFPYQNIQIEFWMFKMMVIFIKQTSFKKKSYVGYRRYIIILPLYNSHFFMKVSGIHHQTPIFQNHQFINLLTLVDKYKILFSNRKNSQSQLKKQLKGQKRHLKQMTKQKTKQQNISFPPNEDFIYGIFIYPSNKPSGYRHKPNDYPELQLAVDVPRSIIHII
ncbi:unnamed protein product [Paramecium octaurelia]|uniref:Uncharacterized protein n=1 Tax=Paramecium octaurelia TaxID=43137 RepID=A0A8S1VK78_PAROT|nr:unnamed protein product [Paramecium octaurelia]